MNAQTILILASLAIGIASFCYSACFRVKPLNLLQVVISVICPPYSWFVALKNLLPRNIDGLIAGLFAFPIIIIFTFCLGEYARILRGHRFIVNIAVFAVPALLIIRKILSAKGPPKA